MSGATNSAFPGTPNAALSSTRSLSGISSTDAVFWSLLRRGAEVIVVDGSYVDNLPKISSTVRPSKDELVKLSNFAMAAEWSVPPSKSTHHTNILLDERPNTNIGTISGFTSNIVEQRRGRIVHSSNNSFHGQPEASRAPKTTRGAAGGGCDVRTKTQALWVQDTLEQKSRTSGVPSTSRRWLTVRLICRVRNCNDPLQES